LGVSGEAFFRFGRHRVCVTHYAFATTTPQGPVNWQLERAMDNSIWTRVDADPRTIQVGLSTQLRSRHPSNPLSCGFDGNLVKRIPCSFCTVLMYLEPVSTKVRVAKLHNQDPLTCRS
jgi:hypothetical protein